LKEGTKWLHQDADGENVERGQGEMLSPETEKLDGTDDAFHERGPLGTEPTKSICSIKSEVC